MEGLKVPMGVNKMGGLARLSDEKNNRKIISLALGDDDNENAFQQNIGVGEGMIFDLNDPILRAQILNKIIIIFDLFEREKRFKLREDTIKWSESSLNQELTLEFKYLDIESDEEDTFEKLFNEKG